MAERTLRRIAYKLSPSALRSRDWGSLDDGTKGVYIDVLNALWCTTDGYRMKEDDLPIGTEVALDRLVSGGFLQRHMDEELDARCIVSQELREQCLEHQAALASDPERDEDRRRTRPSARQAEPLFDGLTTAHAPEASRVLSVYEGWLPTNRWSAKGQHVMLGKQALMRWGKKFPGVDIEAELNRMFQYFAKHPTKRPPPDGLNGYVERWFDGILSRDDRFHLREVERLFLER